MKTTKRMNAALFAEGLCWSKSGPDAAGTAQAVLVAADHPAASEDARNSVSLISMVAVTRTKGVSAETLAAAYRAAKIDGDDSELLAILGAPP